MAESLDERGSAEAAPRCAASSHAGGKHRLTQWTDDVDDDTYIPPVRGLMGTLFASA